MEGAPRVGDQSLKARGIKDTLETGLKTDVTDGSESVENTTHIMPPPLCPPIQVLGSVNERIISEFITNSRRNSIMLLSSAEHLHTSLTREISSQLLPGIKDMVRRSSSQLGDVSGRGASSSSPLYDVFSGVGETAFKKDIEEERVAPEVELEITRELSDEVGVRLGSGQRSLMRENTVRKLSLAYGVLELMTESIQQFIDEDKIFDSEKFFRILERVYENYRDMTASAMNPLLVKLRSHTELDKLTWRMVNTAIFNKTRAHLLMNYYFNEILIRNLIEILMKKNMWEFKQAHEFLHENIAVFGMNRIGSTNIHLLMASELSDCDFNIVFSDELQREIPEIAIFLKDKLQADSERLKRMQIFLEISDFTVRSIRQVLELPEEAKKFYKILGSDHTIIFGNHDIIDEICPKNPKPLINLIEILEELNKLYNSENSAKLSLRRITSGNLSEKDLQYAIFLRLAVFPFLIGTKIESHIFHYMVNPELSERLLTRLQEIYGSTMLFMIGSNPDLVASQGEAMSRTRSMSLIKRIFYHFIDTKAVLCRPADTSLHSSMLSIKGELEHLLEVKDISADLMTLVQEIIGRIEDLMRTSKSVMEIAVFLQRVSISFYKTIFENMVCHEKEFADSFRMEEFSGTDLYKFLEDKYTVFTNQEFAFMLMLDIKTNQKVFQAIMAKIEEIGLFKEQQIPISVLTELGIVEGIPIPEGTVTIDRLALIKHLWQLVKEGRSSELKLNNPKIEVKTFCLYFISFLVLEGLFLASKDQVLQPFENILFLLKMHGVKIEQEIEAPLTPTEVTPT